MDNRPLKAKNNESGTITALLTASEVTTAHVSPVPENAPGLIFINPGTSEEECIYYKERDAGLGTISGLTRDVENQNGGVGREAQANAPWETLQSVRYVNNLVDMLIEGYVQETNDVAYVSATSFTVKTNRSAFYTKGRIVRFDDSAIGVVSADSTYVAGTGLTTVLVTGTVPNPILTVELGIQHKGRTDVFASGSDINTGTDLYKIVTPKAIADSKLTDFIRGDGWISANETWTYASASTITVPSGAAAKYAKGDKIKLTQTTVKYFYIVGVADTVLTVTGGDTYTVANEAITLNYYSHASSPIGFPCYFTYTPTFSGSAGSIGTFVITQNRSRFSINGRTCHWQGIWYVSNVGSWSGNFRCTAPVNAASSSEDFFGYVANQNSTWGQGPVFFGNPYFASSSIIYFHKAIGTSDVQWSDLTARFDVIFSGDYEI